MSLKQLLRKIRWQAAYYRHLLHAARRTHQAASGPSCAVLEERILMSATPLAAAVDPAATASAAATQDASAAAGSPAPLDAPELASDAALVAFRDELQAAAADTSDQGQSGSQQHTAEIVFVDAAVEDSDQLLADLRDHGDPDRSIEVFVLDGDRDGIDQVTQILSKFSDVDAVHIVSHSTDGQVKLGNVWLTADNLNAYAGDIAQWQSSLSGDADLLFYGCELAQTDHGRALMQSIAALCDCDVAASEDNTGHAIFGGDWDLEFNIGQIDTELAFSTDVQQEWFGLLNVNVESTTTGTAGNSASNVVVSHTTSANANRLMLVGVSFGEDKGDRVTSVTYGGQAMTLVGARDHSDSSQSRVEIWGLVAPNSGTNNVTVNLGPNPIDHQGVTVGVTTFSNVDQFDAWGTFASATGDSSNASVSVESASTEVVFGVAALSNSSNQNWTPGAGQTELWDLFSSKANGTGTTEAGAASVTTSFSSSPGSGKWVAGGVSVRKLTAVVDTTADYNSGHANWGDTSSIENLIGNKGNDNAISLREALEAAKNTAGVDTINFDIAGAGPHTISLNSALPVIDHEVIINGWGEPDFAGTPIIELDGSSVGSDGLYFTSGGSNSIVRGLVINNFGGDAIEIDGGANIRIEGNYLGTNSSGTAAASNTGGGINITSGAGNIIGGTTAAARNIISGNLNGQINLSGSGANTTTIQGNYIGLNAAGTAALTNNGFNGIWIASGSANNVIGGTTAGARNVIAGMDEQGIELEGSSTSGNIIQGNYIGLNAAGSATLANGGEGIAIEDAAANQIGGTAAGAGNVIGGNTGAGIIFAGSAATGNTIEGNFIGTDSTGTANYGNTGAGISFVNSFESAAGGAQLNTIGGTASGAGNIIAFNATDGVRIAASTAVDNAILRNQFHSNGQQAIDLGTSGVTANDSGVQDADTGANHLQNFPVIVSAIANSSGSSVDFTVNLDSFANSTFRIEFFENQNSESHGEAVRYLGSGTVNTNGSGMVSGEVITVSGFGAALQNLDYVTATATLDDAGTLKSTSEFGSNQIVQFRPGISVNGTRSFVEDSAAVTLDPSVTISDIDSPHFSGGSLTMDIDDANGTTNDRLIIADEGAGANQIHLTGPNNIHYNGNATPFATYSGGTSDTDPLVITFTNNLATQAAVERLAERIQFDNVSNTPSEAQRTVTFVVNDGTLNSVTDSVAVNVSKTNDAPTGSVTISGTTTEDEILTAANTLNDADGMGVVTYQWQRNGSNIAGATASTYTLDDADAGQNIRVRASYTDGEGNVHQVNSVATAAIVNINDAPVLDNAQTLTFTQVANAPGGNNSNGDSVLDLLLSGGGGNPITDVDPSAVAGIAVNQIDDANGTWQYSTDGGTSWSSIDPDGAGATVISNANALLLQADAGGQNRIRFAADSGYTGTVSSFKFRAWDTTETPAVGNGNYADVNTLGTGGTTAFSTAEETAAISVVNPFVLDQFNATSYSGNDGTHNWTGNWIENDNASASSGDIRVLGTNELRIRGNTLGESIYREVDLSAATSATLTFQSTNNVLSTGQIVLEISSDGGAGWTTLKTYSLFNGGSLSESFDITGHIAPNTQIRFRVASVLTGSTVVVDDVRIEYTAPANPTADLWFTTKGNGNATGTSWTDAEVIQFGNAGNAWEPSGGVTSGTFAKLSGFSAPADIRAMHYVESNVRIGLEPNEFWVQKGDLILTLDPGGGAPPATVTLNAGESNAFLADRQDIVVFRPSTISNYNEAAGEWFMLLDSSVADATKTLNVHGLSLVEVDTAVGGTTLTEGTLVVAHANPNHQDIATLAITGTGANSAANLIQNLLTGATLGNAADQIQGIHLLQQDTSFDSTTLSSGTLLVQVNASGVYAGINHEAVDVMALTITQTEQDAAPGTAASGLLLFDGSDVQLDDAANEPLNGLSLISSSFTGSSAAVGPVSDSDAAADEVVENAAIGSAVGITATATDVGDTVMYSLDDDAAGRFEIHSTSGVVTVKSALDYETASGHNITVRSTSSDASTSTQSFTINVLPVNDHLPTIISGGGANAAAVNVAENSTAVTTVAATDSDLPVQTLTYSITGGVDAAKFAIDANSGALTFASAPDFETPTDVGADNVYDVQVQVSDGAGGTDTQDIAVSVQNVDESPDDLNFVGSTVAENASNGAVVSTANASDPERSARMTTLLNSTPGLSYNASTDKFYLHEATAANWNAAQTDAVSRTLNGVTGRLVTIRSAAENTIVHTIAAGTGQTIWLGASDQSLEGDWRWYDGLAAEDSFWAGDDTGAAVNSAYENWDGGEPNNAGNEDFARMYASGARDTLWDDGRGNLSHAYVIEWSATDVLNATDALTYSLIDSSGGRFAIDSNSGVITVANSGLLNHEAAGSHDITVRVTDKAANTYDESFTITVGDVNESPVITTDGGANTAAVNTTENSTAVTTVSAADPDLPAQTLTYSISGGADAAKFTIDGSSGVLTFVAAPDFETPTDVGTNNIYDVQVQVSDGAGGTDTQDIAVTVTDQPVTTISATGSSTVTTGAVYTLNLSADEDVGSWNINWGDGTFQAVTGSASSVAHTYTNTGFTNNILVSAVDASGTVFNNQLIVASSQNDRLMRYSANGSFLQQFAVGHGTDFPLDVITGPDGNLYVSGWNSDNVLRYSGNSGAFMGTFVAARAGGLDSAAGLAFGSDGNLYVASRSTGQVLRFDGTTGAFIDVFVTANSGGIVQPEGLIFGPDGHLYVSDYDNSGGVYRYDGITGAFESVFVTPGSGGLATAEDLEFGPDGHLYVASDLADKVLRFNGTTGAYIDDFVTAGSNGLDGATGLTFGPDGNLYVGSWQTNSVLRFEGNTGAAIDAFVSAGSGGLALTDFLSFRPNLQVTVTNTAPEITSNGGGSAGLASVTENLTAVTTVTATDADVPSQSLTFSIAGGLDAASFTIDANSGALSFASPPDYESPTDSNGNNIYTVVVQVSDGEGGTDTQNLIIFVRNQNEFAVSAATDSDAALNQISEVTSNGTTVGITAQAADNDSTDNTVTYSLDNNAGGRFAIAGGSGIVTVNNAGLLDYEAATSHTITVRATSADGSSSVQNFSIDVLPVDDEAPVFTSLASVNLAENNPNVVTLTATDADVPTTPITFSIIGGDDAALFRITGSDVLKLTPPADFESPTDANGDNVYELSIRASDGAGNVTVQNLFVTVTNENEKPSITSNGGGASANINVVHNTAFVTTLSAIDADVPAQTLTYTIAGGSDAARFTVNGSTGDLSFVAAPDHAAPTDADANNIYHVTVQVSDGAGGTDSQNISVTIVPSNATPAGSVTVSGTPVQNAALTANHTLTDADGLGTILWQWRRDGADIAGATSSTYRLSQTDVGAQIRVVATYLDGGGTTESVASGTVGPVANVNDAPRGSVSISGTPTEGKTLTASHTVTDADGMGTISWQWLREGSAIAGANGISYRLTGADVGTNISVSASWVDQQGTAEQAISPTVGPISNVNNKPTGSVVISGLATEDEVLTASHTLADADGLRPVRYQWLRNGAAVVGATGSTYVLGDDDVGQVLSVEASYTDGHGTLESVRSSSVGPVSNVNDAPVVAPVSAITIDEDYAVGSVIAIVTASDPDPLDNVSWAITAGDEDGQFVISPDGSIVLVGPLNFATASDYRLTVTATDSGTPGLSGSTTVTVIVNRLVVPAPAPESPPAEAETDDSTDEEATDSTSTSPIAPGPAGEPVATAAAEAAHSAGKKQQPEAPVAALTTAIAKDPTPVFLMPKISTHLTEVVEARYASATAEFSRHASSSEPETSAAPRYEMAFRSVDLNTSIEQMKTELQASSKTQYFSAATAVTTTSSLTVGYVLWAIRGGWLASSILAQMPAWRLMDPLVVLSSLDGGGAAGDDQSLQDMLKDGVRELDSEEPAV